MTHTQHTTLHPSCHCASLCHCVKKNIVPNNHCVKHTHYVKQNTAARVPLSAILQTFALIMQPTTYDRALRLLRNTLILCALFFLLKRLSAVLIPFLLAWLIAYLLYPIVRFLQYRCRLRLRTLAILATFTLIIALIWLIGWLIVTSVQQEFAEFGHTLMAYLATLATDAQLTQPLLDYAQAHIDFDQLSTALTPSDIATFLQKTFSALAALVTRSLNALLSMIASLFAIVYLFFILQDYEHMAEAAMRMVPPKSRRQVAQLLDDVKKHMQAYFRGQSLIALLVGIGFATGFSIVGYPMAIPLGLFIGVLNLVPYLQIVGIIPTVLLAGLRCYQTGENFWYVLMLAAIVFVCVQSIQDWILIPRIMGKVTGYNGAIIFLALSIWGSLLGLVGMIIALPLTSIIVAYYKHYVLHTTRNEDETEQQHTP